MDKNAISAPVQQWGTTKSKYPPDSKLISTDEFTAGTRNIDSRSRGVLIKRPGGVPYSSTAFASKIQDQYEAIFSDGARHLLVQEGGRIQFSTGDTQFTQVASGFAIDTNFEFATIQDRVYFDNGVNSPQVYDRTTTYGGVVYAAPFVKAAGTQPPVSAPTVAVVATGNVPVGPHTYKITFLYYEGEESNGGPSSLTATTTAGNQQVNLSVIPVGGYGVTARKVYRDNADGNYVLVGTITDNVATTFSDTAAGGTTPLPTDQGLPPVFALITTFLNRLFVSKVTASPYTVFFSEVNQPDIFSEANTILCNQEDPIIGMIVYQDKIIVFNRKSFGQILGQTSDTFRYSHIPGSIGCVDNRTIQVRTLNGIPILVWLSDKGFYTYNGQSVNYISEEIEDIISLNIQQASQQKGQNTQSTQLDFQQGTASGGIDLITDPGFITTPNPKQSYSSQVDWEAATNVNTVTRAGDGLLKAPTHFNPLFNTGTLSGDVVQFSSGTQLEIKTTNPITLSSVPLAGISGTQFAQVELAGTYFQPVGFAVRRSVALAGTFTTVFAYFGQGNASYNGHFKIYTDNAGQPGTLLFDQLIAVPSSGFVDQVYSAPNFNANLHVAAGNYWFSFEAVNYLGVSNFDAPVKTNYTETHPTLHLHDGVWHAMPLATNGLPVMTLPHQVAFSQDPVATAGSWTSNVYDSQSIYIGTGATLTQSATLPNGGLSTVVEASDDILFLTGVLSQTFTNLNGVGNVTLTGKRYWRIKQFLSTSDRSGVNPHITVRQDLKFSTVATWESNVLDTTSDSTIYNSLVMASTVPGGTSATVQIATSASNLGPWTYVNFGTHVVRQFVRFKITITTNAANTVTPSVSSLSFTWTIVSNLISQALDTAVSPPAGWDIFQMTSTGNVVVQQRSSATLVGLSSATFFTVTNGAFPPASLTPLRYTQWKVILTSLADLVPTVDSVTVSWFISQVKAIRPASIFHDRSYFMSAASFGSLINDILFEFDMDDMWRVHSGATIATFSFFYNEPYYGSASISKIFKFGQGLLDDGITPIAFDMRGKAFDFTSSKKENSDTMKTIQDIWLVGTGTGCAYSVYYSVDNGLTFIQMLDQSGTSSYTTTNDGKRFVRRFRAVNVVGGNPVSGRTLMWRVLSNDSFDVKLHNIKMECWVRNQRFFI